MKRTDLDRRGFLKHSATATAVGATLSAGSLTAHAATKAEADTLKNLVGRDFRVGDATMTLRSVDVADYSTDLARPGNLRSAAISLLFILKNGKLHAQADSLVKLDGIQYQLHLTQVVAPEGESGHFYEAILN
jgi:hypothetical protein